MQFKHRETERIRPPATEGSPCADTDEPQDGSRGPQESDRQGLVVHHGIHSGNYRVAGLTVGQARRMFGRPMNISPDAVAVIAGEIVEDEDARVLQDTDHMLSFVQRSSIKGTAGLNRSTASGGGN